MSITIGFSIPVNQSTTHPNRKSNDGKDLKDGSFDGLDGLDPTLKWSSTLSLTSGSTKIEVDGGIDLDASLSLS